MPKKDIDPTGSLGDIDFILHNQGVADLSWLSVDEADYRSFEALPKQNLDIIPEVQRALEQDDEGIPHIIPLRPHTIVNHNPLFQPNGNSSTIVSMTPIRNRVAQLVIKNLPVAEISNRLRLEFAQSDINNAKSEIEELIKERGLLGNIYINSSHFPRCHQGDGKELISKYAKKALYVVSKDNCSDCVHNKDQVCSIFKKRLVSSLSYDEKLIGQYSQKLAAEGRPVRSYGDAKERLQEAFLKSIALHQEPVRKIVEQHNREYKPTASELSEYLNRKPVEKPENLSSAYIKYAIRMMSGFDDRKVLSSSTDPDLRALSKQFGILGNSYLDMDALGGCRKTSVFIHHHKLSPSHLIRRSSSCNICMNTSDGCCSDLSAKFKISHDSVSVINKDMFIFALKKAVFEKRLSVDKARLAFRNVSGSANFHSLVSQVNLLKPESEPIRDSVNFANVHYGSPNHVDTNDQIDPEYARQSILRLMNTGISGRALKNAILNIYTASDLSKIFGPDSENQEIGKTIISNDGIQGFYFIDPSVYKDYGKGCKQGSEQFKHKGAPYIFAGTKCTGCNLQIAPGWCSKYSKELIRSVPESVFQAKQKTNKAPLPVISNDQNPVFKYELSSDMNFTIKERKLKKLDINLNTSGRIPD